MLTSRSSGPNDPNKTATLERLDVLSRWSVGARRAKRYLSEFMRQSTSWVNAGPRYFWE